MTEIILKFGIAFYSTVLTIARLNKHFLTDLLETSLRRRIIKSRHVPEMKAKPKWSMTNTKSK